MRLRKYLTAEAQRRRGAEFIVLTAPKAQSITLYPLGKIVVFACSALVQCLKLCASASLRLKNDEKK